MFGLILFLFLLVILVFQVRVKDVFRGGVLSLVWMSKGRVCHVRFDSVSASLL